MGTSRVTQRSQVVDNQRARVSPLIACGESAAATQRECGWFCYCVVSACLSPRVRTSICFEVEFSAVFSVQCSAMALWFHCPTLWLNIGQLLCAEGAPSSIDLPCSGCSIHRPCSPPKNGTRAPPRLFPKRSEARVD